MNCLNYLTTQGLTLTIKKDRLIVEPKSLLTSKLRAYITTHKQTIKSQLLQTQRQQKNNIPTLEQLSQEKRHWLSQIANYLNTTPEYLLQYQLLDQYDLVELIDKEPLLIANTIKQGYYWHQAMLRK